MAPYDYIENNRIVPYEYGNSNKWKLRLVLEEIDKDESRERTHRDHRGRFDFYSANLGSHLLFDPSSFVAFDWLGGQVVAAIFFVGHGDSSDEPEFELVSPGRPRWHPALQLQRKQPEKKQVPKIRDKSLLSKKRFDVSCVVVVMVMVSSPLCAFSL